MKTRILSVSLAIAVVLGMSSMPALAYEAWEAIFTQPGLKPGDALRAGAYGSFDYGYNDEFADVFVNPGPYQWTVLEHVVVGDCIEITEAVMTYEDGTIIEAYREYFSDGERVVFYQDQSKPIGMRCEVFVGYRIVAGSSNTVNARVINNLASSGVFCSPEMAIERNAPAPSRPKGDASVFSIITEFEQNFFVYTDPATLPIPYEKPSSWAESEVIAATMAKLVPQGLQSKYTQAATRAEYCALAVALYERVTGAEIAGRKTFGDTTDINVEKAAYIGVVAGVGDNRFAPNDSLTREQSAVMLARLAEALGQPYAPAAPTFTDNAQISSWALGQVGQVQEAGIMWGVGGGRFAPKDSYTREQSIVTLLRLFNALS